jgi:hypothetical protein
VFHGGNLGIRLDRLRESKCAATFNGWNCGSNAGSKVPFGAVGFSEDAKQIPECKRGFPSSGKLLPKLSIYKNLNAQ